MIDLGKYIGKKALYINYEDTIWNKYAGKVGEIVSVDAFVNSTFKSVQVVLLFEDGFSLTVLDEEIEILD